MPNNVGFKRSGKLFKDLENVETALMFFYENVLHRVGKRHWTLVREKVSNDNCRNIIYLASYIRPRLDIFKDKIALKTLDFGQRCWNSWQICRFRIQRSAVRIQSSTRSFILFAVDSIENTKIKNKRWGMAHLNNRRSQLHITLKNFMKPPQVFLAPIL